MKHTILVWLILFTVGKLAAYDREWYTGAIVLQTQEVLIGAIGIEPEHGIVLHKQGDQVYIYPAHRVQSLHFFDSKANINRKYISLQHGTWRRCHLYEVVVKGSVTIVRREKRNISPVYSDADSFIYYIYTEGELVQLRSFRKQIYPALRQAGGVQFSMFVLEQHLNPNDDAHAIRMVQYYNALVLSDETLATKR